MPAHVSVDLPEVKGRIKGTRPESDMDEHKKMRVEIGGGGADSDDSDDGAQIPAMDSKAEAKKRRGTLIRQRMKEAMGEERAIHKSLQEALDSDPVVLAREGRLRMRRTMALQGARAEAALRAHRPASREATFVLGAKDDLQYTPSPSKVKRPGKVATAPVGMSRAEALARGYKDTMSDCPFGQDCQLAGNETHMKRFRHKCLKEDFCWQRHDPEHCKYFSHAPTADDIKKEEMRRILEEKGSGWHYEKLTLEPLPYRSASVYQRQNPPLSSCPRGGFRPSGGSSNPTELNQLSRGDSASRNTVSVLIEGINLGWRDDDLATFVRDHGGFDIPILSAKVFYYKGNQTGTGRVVVGTYEDAAKLQKKLHNFAYENRVTHVKYENELFDPEKGKKVPTTMNTRGDDRAMINLSVREYNNKIRDCGPYALDALALKERMESEGHKPDSITYTHIIRSFKDAKPPMPERAEAMVWEMVSKGMKPTATQSNLVVEAWSKAGNMRRAEMFADQMDPVSRNREDVALATEDTYQILKEGWALAGVSNEIQDRQELVGTMKKTLTERISVPGANEPAKSTTSLWGRKRSGYMNLSTGMIAPDQNSKVPWKDIVMAKWRSKW